MKCIITAVKNECAVENGDVLSRLYALCARVAANLRAASAAGLDIYIAAAYRHDRLSLHAVLAGDEGQIGVDGGYISERFVAVICRAQSVAAACDGHFRVLESQIILAVYAVVLRVYGYRRGVDSKRILACDAVVEVGVHRQAARSRDNEIGLRIEAGVRLFVF